MEENRANDVIQNDILTALSEVDDPELGVDIVNLGLVYQVDLKEEGLCVVQMTLTTMGCPLTGLISQSVESALLKIPEINQVIVEFIWEPAWSIERMTRYARLALGLN